MFEIQRTSRLHELVGRTSNGDIVNVPNLLCVRKHMERSHRETSKFLNHKQSKMFAFVSSPRIVDQQSSFMKGIKVWCHPFRDRSKKLKEESCRYIMMPESDFMDASFVRKNTNKPIEYDFFYMTLDAKSGIKHKGLKQFIKSLPVLCGELNLKCLVVVYYPAVPYRKSMKMLVPYKDIISRYEHNITFMWGWQKQNRLANIMSSCRFGFFPNTVDCSPRLIPECILRNVPVLVNENIWGGWHYVNKNTGAFFNPKKPNTILKSVDMLLSSNFEPADDFMKRFGFVKSARRLADFLSGTFDEAKQFTHIYFRPYGKIMEKML